MAKYVIKLRIMRGGAYPGLNCKCPYNQKEMGVLRQKIGGNVTTEGRDWSMGPQAKDVFGHGKLEEFPCCSLWRNTASPPEL